MLGPSEHAILSGLQGLKGAEATTTEIYKMLSGRLKIASLGAIYLALDRMIKRKLIARRRGEPLPERGGKARYYYKITISGRAALIEAQKATTALNSFTAEKLATRG